MPIDPSKVQWDERPDPAAVKWDAPAPRKQGGRNAQLAGRSIAQGAAGTVDMIWDAAKKFPGMSLIEIATRGLPSVRDAAQTYLTSQDVARPETSGERIASDVGEALTGTALTMGAGMGSGVRFLTKNPVVQGLGATTGTAAASYAREQGANPLVQTLVALGAGAAPAVVRSGAPAAVRGVMRGGEQGRKRVIRNIEDFRVSGTTPTVGQATEGRIARATESLLGRLPASAGVIARKAEQQGAEIGAGVRRVAEGLAPGADAETAGRAIKSGIIGSGPDSFQSRTGATTGRLYDKLDERMGQDSRVSVQNTAAVMDELNPTIPGAPELSKQFQNARIGGIKAGFEADTAGTNALLTRPDMAEWADNMRSVLREEADQIAQENVRRRGLMLPPLPVPSPAAIEAQIQGRLRGMVDDRLPYEAVKKTRTLVGKELANANFASTVPSADWRALYGGLSGDMRNAAADAGPEAMQAFNRANKHFRAVQDRSDAISHVVNKDAPEQVFAAAMQGTKDGATTLRSLLRSLPEGSQKQVAAAVLNRLGRAVSSQQNAEGTAFSTSTFLTNWNNLSDAARSALFDRFGPEFRAQVQSITRTADNLRDGSKVYSNPSGTAAAAAQVGGATALGTTGLTGLITGNWLPFGGVVAGGALTGGLSRLMMRPGSAAWLAERTPVPYSAAVPITTNQARSEEQTKQDDARRKNKAKR